MSQVWKLRRGRISSFPTLITGSQHWAKDSGGKYREDSFQGLIWKNKSASVTAEEESCDIMYRNAGQTLLLRSPLKINVSLTPLAGCWAVLARAYTFQCLWWEYIWRPRYHTAKYLSQAIKLLNKADCLLILINILSWWPVRLALNLKFRLLKVPWQNVAEQKKPLAYGLPPFSSHPAVTVPDTEVCGHLTTSSTHNPSDLAFSHPLAMHLASGFMCW